MWPIVVFAIVLVFRADISSLLKRIRKGKVLGQEVELDPEVKEFKKTVEEAGEEIPVLPKDEEESEQAVLEFDRDTKEVLDAASVNPELGIMKLSSLLEREIRALAASRGILEKTMRISFLGLFDSLVSAGLLPKHTSESIRTFWRLRNEIVHGKKVEPARNTVIFLDVGLNLLETVRSIPRQTITVYKKGIELFADSDCSETIADATGVILKITSDDGIKTRFQIFPTTKSNYYREGQEVSWEWDLSKVWDSAWYIDPDTNEKQAAWGSSGEFTGRHLEDI